MRLTTTGDIGALFKTRRGELGWSQAHLASRIGITRQWVMELEKGNPGVSTGIVLRAMAVLGLLLHVAPAEPERDPSATAAPPGSGSPTHTLDPVIDQIIERARAESARRGSSVRPPLPLARRRGQPRSRT